MMYADDMSSAYIVINVPSEKPRSAIYTQLMYVKGPRTDPCGTPDQTDVVLDDASSTATYCFLQHRYEEIHWRMCELRPIPFRCSIEILHERWTVRL